MAIGGVGTFTGTTGEANKELMTEIRATAGITNSKTPMVFKGIHFESTEYTTIKINNRIALKLKPSALVSDNYFIDLDENYKIGSIIVTEADIAWEVTGRY